MFKLKEVLKIQADYEKEAESKKVDEEVRRTIESIDKEATQDREKTEDPSKDSLTYKNKQLEKEITEKALSIGNLSQISKKGKKSK